MTQVFLNTMHYGCFARCRAVFPDRLKLRKWNLLECHPVLLLAKSTISSFQAEVFCPRETDSEDVKDAFGTLKMIYESLLNELPQQHVCEEQEVLTEQQLWNQERNSSLDQEEPESLQMKEEQEQICTSHEGEQLEVKQEADIIMVTLDYDHMKPEPDSDQQLLSQSSANVEKIIIKNEEDVDLQQRLFHMKWSPVIKLHRTELPQEHVCKEEEVLTEQQLWNQERNSSLDQEEPESLQMKEEQEQICTSHEGEQLEVKQEADTLMLTPDNEKSDDIEPEPDSDQQLLSHSSAVAESQDQTGCNHVDSVSNRNVESKPPKRSGGNKVDDCHTSKTESESLTSKRSFKCGFCGKKLSVKSQLIKHIRVHTGEKPFSCPTCAKCFGTKRNMLDHTRIHTGEKPYSCKTCGKCFRGSSHLTVHERIHSGEKPYSCKTCGKSFGQLTSLSYHERTHTSEKPFLCKTCGKCFKHSQGLTVHEKTHTGEKPYSCKTCGKCYSRGDSLIVHERTHTGEKPYSCETCGTCFSRSQALIVHQRTHTGEKPFTCKICGRCFSRKHHMIKHMKTHRLKFYKGQV